MEASKGHAAGGPERRANESCNDNNIDNALKAIKASAPKEEGRRTKLKISPGLVARVFDFSKHLKIVGTANELFDLLDRLYRLSERALVRSKISWTQYGWSPLVGCTECSSGCRFCYAKLLHDRRHGVYLSNGGLWKPGGKPMPMQYAEPFKVVQLLAERLGNPLQTKRPGRVFVNPSSDIFHSDVPLEYIQLMFLVMGACPHLTFQPLTKRAERMAELADKLPWFPNIQMGVTIEHLATAARADLLRQIPAAVKWISAEPLLGSLSDLNLEGINWVVVGGESGAKDQVIRATHPDWFRQLREKCLAGAIAFFFKQQGDDVHESQLAGAGLLKKTKGRPVFEWPDGTKSYRFGRVRVPDVLDGNRHHNYPKDAKPIWVPGDE